MSSAPTKEKADTANPLSPKIKIASTALALAPEVMPMMSGLASGFLIMAWKIAPEMPKHSPTSRPGHHPRQPQLVDDEVGGPGAAPGEGVEQFADRDRVVTDHHGRRKGHGQQHEQTDRDQHRTPLQPEADAADGVDSRGWSGAEIEGLDGGHSSANFRRRTRAMNTGAPINAVTMPTCTSPGRAITRPTMSAASNRIGASVIEYGSAQR